MKRPNGAGSVYWVESRKRYIAQVKIYDPFLRQMHRSFVRKKDALAALPDMMDELLTGTGKKKQALTIEALYTGWEPAMSKLSSSKQTAYKIAYRRISRIYRAFIKELGINDLQGLVEGLTYYQARDIKNLLSHLYQRAMAEQEVSVNLSTFIELPTLEEKEAEPFSEEEVRKLWSAYGDGDMIAGHILLMIYTGMMPGELLGAKKDMIDWDQQRIVGAGLKTKERKSRSIMVPDIILTVLHRIADGRSKVVLLGRDYWYAAYHAFTARIGIRDLPPYACRHTTATALALGDSNPLLITRVMRQARPMTTERYKHADEESVLRELNKIGSQTVAKQKP